MSHVSAFRRGLLAASALLAAGWLGATPGAAQDVKVGGLFSITGPIASLVPPIVESAKLAAKHINEQGGIGKAGKLDLILADGQCNPQAAAAAAKKLVDVDRVAAIVGELCSSATIAAAESAAIPAGVIMVSPAATAPNISTLKDNDYLFRTAPSDAYLGEVFAKYLVKRGIKKIAMTYMNNDYGRGVASSFREPYKKAGGVLTADLEHNEKAASFRAELATLAKDKPDWLFVIGYANSSGPLIIKQALEGGFFKKFIGGEGTRDNKLYDQIGIKNLEGKIMAVSGDPASKNLDAFNAALKAVSAGSVGKPFTAHTYDATFMVALAIEMAGSGDRKKVHDALRALGKIGGVAVGPGQWKEAKKAIAEKKKVFYTGAAGNHVFDKNGDVSGVVDILEIKGGKETKIESIK
jgi:branched-chain amino acid transport system substrate-binding protein